LLTLKADLIDVINLTEDLLKIKKNPATKENNMSSTVAKKAQVASSAQTSNKESQFAVGSRCRAKFSDGLWYEALIESVPTNSEEKYFITFVEYNSQAYVGPDEISAATDDTAVNPKKRKDKSADEDTSGIVIPKSLKILPTDSEEERQAKKKRIHIIKSQTRLKKREEERKEKKSAWQEFTSKGSKPGATTTAKRESIFRSPDSVEGKVGVTGSGKPLTPSPSFKATEVAHVKFKITPP